MWACWREDCADWVMSAVSVVLIPKNVEGAGVVSILSWLNSCSSSSVFADVSGLSVNS